MKEKIVLFLLKSLAALPLGVLYLLSDLAYVVIYHCIGYRKKIVFRNLKESFPEKSEKELKEIEKKFYHFLGDQIVETLKLLHISDEEMKKRVEVKSSDLVNDSLGKGRNVVLLMGHYGNWEWVQEISRYFLKGTFMTSIYHPLSSHLWNDLFLKLRGRWGNPMIEMNKAPRVLLNKAHFPWVCGFIADAWTWHKNPDNCIEFLNHPTWFIYGSEEIGRKVDADFFYLEMKRIKRGYYEIVFHRLQPSDLSVPYPYTREFYRNFEKTIIENPPYWLWSHKRWK